MKEAEKKAKRVCRICQAQFFVQKKRDGQIAHFSFAEFCRKQAHTIMSTHLASGQAPSFPRAVEKSVEKVKNSLFFAIGRKITREISLAKMQKWGT